MNAMVFDNSILVVTKEEKELFFTSFVFRDQAIELMQKQLDSLTSNANSRNGSLGEKPIGLEVGIENK